MYMPMSYIGLQTGPSGFGAVQGPSPARVVPPFLANAAWMTVARRASTRSLMRRMSWPPTHDNGMSLSGVGWPHRGDPGGLSGLGKEPVKKMGYKKAAKQVSVVAARIAKRQAAGQAPTQHQKDRLAKLTLQATTRFPVWRQRQMDRKSAPVAPPDNSGTITALAPGWYNGSYWDGSQFLTPPAGSGSGSGGGSNGGGGGGGGDDDAGITYEDPTVTSEDGSDKLFPTGDASGQGLVVDPATGKLVPAQASMFNLKTMLVVGAVAFILVKMAKKKKASEWTYAR